MATAAILFETPEKRQNDKGEPIFYLRLVVPGFTVLHDLEWSKENGLTPIITVQRFINDLRSQILKQLVENKSLFRNPPTMASIQAITPPWGVLVQRGNKLTWSSVGNKWAYSVEEMAKVNAIVRLILTGIEISRTSIIPVWNLGICRTIPDSKLIDFDFDTRDGMNAREDDMKSVGSDDFIEDSSDVVQLHNPNARKKALKAEVRRLMKAAENAQMEADDALGRFFDEYDLSDGESDFSETEED